jgi:hypothetical protein
VSKNTTSIMQQTDLQIILQHQPRLNKQSLKKYLQVANWTSDQVHIIGFRQWLLQKSLNIIFISSLKAGVNCSSFTD